MWTSADYELAWPRSVFVRELEALVPPPDLIYDRHEMQWLLEEAFVSEQPTRAFSSASKQGRENEFVDELLEHQNELPENSWFRPYWPNRQGPGRRRAVEKQTVYRRFRDLIENLRCEGYLDKELTEACPVNESNDSAVDHNEVLGDLLGPDDLWPLAPEAWDDDTFYGLVEVFHDLVARPRSVEGCRAAGCIGHDSNFGVESGRAIYRWKVNRLSESGGDGLRLADRGEDVGRLVRMTDDPRTELVERALDGAQPEAASRVAHAVALFRRPGPRTRTSAWRLWPSFRSWKTPAVAQGSAVQQGRGRAVRHCQQIRPPARR